MTPPSKIGPISTDPTLRMLRARISGFGRIGRREFIFITEGENSHIPLHGVSRKGLEVGNEVMVRSVPGGYKFIAKFDAPAPVATAAGGMPAPSLEGQVITFSQLNNSYQIKAGSEIFWLPMRLTSNSDQPGINKRIKIVVLGPVAAYPGRNYCCSASFLEVAAILLERINKGIPFEKGSGSFSAVTVSWSEVPGTIAKGRSPFQIGSSEVINIGQGTYFSPKALYFAKQEEVVPVNEFNYRLKRGLPPKFRIAVPGFNGKQATPLDLAKALLEKPLTAILDYSAPHPEGTR